jgi:hypothetical protein
MDPAVRAYYTAHSRFGDPGPHARLLDALPTDPGELHAALNGLLVHLWKVRRDDPERLDRAGHDVWTRHVSRLLDRVLALDPRPLDLARPVERRAVVDCRHFALLLTAVLRERGVPTRARCGFATYLEETHHEDHWVCEFWDEGRRRWVMDDPDLQRHDVPPDEFVTGGRAWQRCRDGDAACERFGFGPDDRGQWVARVNLVRDFAALNGFESVTGDAWGLAFVEEPAIGAGDLATLDRAAALAASDDGYDERRALYAASEGLRAPAVIHHFDYLTTFAWREVAWEEEA